ncbi:hypothetical protein E6H30_00020 [Candidatus Bathyarchaeota archaeon]|nr:MAG: hypothetical protein E6H30_00020 [Candidatus Bathyarchaeota archaeon]
MDIPSRFSNHTRTIVILLLTLTSGLVLTSGLLTSASAAKTNGTSTFTTYELGGNPFVVGNSVGTVCPNTVGTCTNTEGEPAIRADPSGNFYGSSENVFCVVDRQCGGTFAWRSTDNGNHFTTLPLPDSVSTGSNGFSPAGGDTDIAVAPVRNNNGFYNIYVASLATAPPLANVYVSTSHDGGASWVLNPTGATIPVDDREWIAADGANKVCVSYHAYATTNNIFVDCSYDGGTTFTQVANAFDSSHAFNAFYNNEIGNLAIDPNNHLIYQSFSSIANAGEETCLNCSTHVVWIAVSIDGGISFTDYQVYVKPDVTVGYGHQFVNVSVDQAGNVYLVYNDNHIMFYSFSTSFGQSWNGPFRINSSPSSTAIFPWSSAGPAGTLDVVWYGSSYYDGVNPPDSYPMTASWQVYFAQNLAATTPNSKWSQTTASGIVHYGGVCESGVTCTGNRDLLDDFGVAVSPTTGFASIIYTSDQYVNSANEPAQPFGSGGGCTQSSTNSFECSHTDIAVQTGGTSLLSTRQHFQITKTDFEQISKNPSLTVQVTNVGNVAINALTAQISGLPLDLPWTPALALQPGQTATATTGTLPATLLLTVGTVYTITITATLSDGTTETQTVSAIYTIAAGIGL